MDERTKHVRKTMQKYLGNATVIVLLYCPFTHIRTLGDWNVLGVVVCAGGLREWSRDSYSTMIDQWWLVARLLPSALVGNTVVTEGVPQYHSSSIV